MTDNMMRTAMKTEQMGSTTCQPNVSTRSEEMITPTLPRVSARTCRNTPGGEEEEGSYIQGLLFCLVAESKS